jgi:catechol-2,3-dioxygenase
MVMPNIRGIAEIVLNVHDLAAARAFYAELLGLEVISPPDFKGPLFLEAGSGHAGVPQMIVLVPMPDGSPRFESPRPLHHLALEVDPEEFDAWEATFRSRGLTLRTGKHPVIPSRTMYVDDPEGNEVEIICRA